MAISRDLKSYLATVARIAAAEAGVSYYSLFYQANGVKLYGTRAEDLGAVQRMRETVLWALKGLDAEVAIRVDYRGCRNVFIRFP